jgi:hypothetical protein
VAALALGEFVVANLAAGLAVVQAVFPQADVELSLAQAAVLVALAALFSLFALTADHTRFCSHALTLARAG